jgi:hypothetical protein
MVSSLCHGAHSVSSRSRSEFISLGLYTSKTNILKRKAKGVQTLFAADIASDLNFLVAKICTDGRKSKRSKSENERWLRNFCTPNERKCKIL